MNQFQVDYLLEQQCSRQWKGYLTSLADEFNAQLSESDLRTLNQRVGARFAASTPLPACRTLADIQAAVNQVWRDNGWGYVDMQQEEQGLRVVHYCAPLKAAFGEKSLAWSPAFLEGAYQVWFAASGAAANLKLRQASDCDSTGTVEYRLSR